MYSILPLTNKLCGQYNCTRSCLIDLKTSVVDISSRTPVITKNSLWPIKIKKTARSSRDPLVRQEHPNIG